MIGGAIALLVIIIIAIVYYSRATAKPNPTPPDEGLTDIVDKVVPVPMAKRTVGGSVIIDAIPLHKETEREEATFEPVYTDEKQPISLTFDASVARAALMRSRDKRVFDAIANRTTDYYRPFFEVELDRNETRDWWDDVAYPINDSGEAVLMPERDTTDATPWDTTAIPSPHVF